MVVSDGLKVVVYFHYKAMLIIHGLVSFLSGEHWSTITLVAGGAAGVVALALYILQPDGSNVKKTWYRIAIAMMLGTTMISVMNILYPDRDLGWGWIGFFTIAVFFMVAGKVVPYLEKLEKEEREDNN